MPRVCIGIARHDLSAAQQLERTLQAHDLIVGHDQESIYGGQQGWSVQGNVYQAAGDIHLTVAQPAEKPEKSLLERWQTWVALFIGVLTITTLAADLPGKIRKIWLQCAAGEGRDR
jgi:hypothetical protein